MKVISKKGQLNTLAPAMIALVFAAVLLIFGLTMVQEIRDTNILSQSISVSIVNETLTTMDEVGEYIADGDAGGFYGTVSYVTNVTSGAVIESANYTFTASTGFINVTAAGGNDAYNGTNWNISYSYTAGDEAHESANTTIIGLGTFADFWEIIVLAIVISIVMALLLLAFGGSKAR